MSSAYFEPGAGFVRPERCVAAQLTLAEQLGARVHRDERVHSLELDAHGATRIRTNCDEYVAGRVVLAVGPWVRDFLEPRYHPLFTVYRQVLAWFAVNSQATDHSPGVMPVFIWGLRDGGSFYGFPEVDGTGDVKTATEQLDVTTSADTATLNVDPAETRALYDGLIGAHLPGVTGRCVRSVRCLYTVTPDADFVVDDHPDLPGVTLVSPCSGHGFKHSAGIGEAIAQVVTTGTSDVDLTPFRMGRFEASAATA